jgi:hypothetical protein
MKAKRRYWTPAEEQALSLHYATTRIEVLASMFNRDPRRVLAKANAMGLYKSRELIAEIAREKSAAPGHGGQLHQFKSGNAPWNKGRNYVAGGRSAETRFKPGNKPPTWVPVGSYRVVDQKNGGPELQVKVNDEPGPNSGRWRPMARHVWEQAHGPVPADHIVVFKPGRRSTRPEDVTLDAVELITRQELMRRNTVHNLPPVFAELARMRGSLHRAINSRKKKEGREAEAP